VRIPLSTYRLQFGQGFGFRQARELVPYLDRLGITDVYASPIFHAHSDSASGYDIVDPTRLSPRLGSGEEFMAFCAELKQHGMGLVLDIVPNHMSANSSNMWWKDVLENGPSSPYAHYFDIEWEPPSRSRGGKMLWPILGAPYADVLERSELTLTFSENGFAIRYFERSLPVDPATYGAILSHVPEAAELMEAIRVLPPSSTTDVEEVTRRRAQAQEIKRRLWSLYTAGDDFKAQLDVCIRTYNGEPGDPRSFDLLDELLDQQPYVLSFWRVAREKVNYRRFFDIADLVGVNVEEPEVFAATHSLIFRLVDEGWVTGLRIDHIDGLFDPADYLRRLRERLPGCFIVVEKILEQEESLCPEWPVSGTTGYDFVNALSSVLVDSAGLDRITREYRRITGTEAAFADVVYNQKKKAIERLFAGEAHSLSLHLNLLAESDRHAKDASPQELQAALLDITASLPVYRTYTRSFQIRSEDLRQIDQALRGARQRNPKVSDTVWNFVRRVLLLDCPPSLNAEQRAGWKQFVQRWQQFSGPVMAKGKEDTAFYIYNSLLSMNEVGGLEKPWTVGEFHRFAETRAKNWPHTMNAGTTHDTKRGEDVRARIHVLAEMPELWARCVKRWQRWNARCKHVLHGVSVPGPNQEYFIYQTLLGAWPLDPNEMDSFRERVQKVLVKSWRESKLYTSWSDPDTEYENAVAEFVDTILAPVAENHFLPDFVKFQARVAAAGACLSLANTLVRLTAPGIPDIYNGAELWELSLVDPDNRRAVNFAARHAQLESLAGRGIPDLLTNWQCGAVKQYVIQQTLNLRRRQPDVFRTGEYIPVEVVGPQADRVIAFARHSGMAWSIVVVPRFPAKLVRAPGLSLDKRPLANVEVTFPESGPRHWSNLFVGKNLEVPASGRMGVAHILGSFPVALLSALPD